MVSASPRPCIMLDMAEVGFILEWEDMHEEGSFIINGLEWEDMHRAVGPETSDNSGSGLSEETIMKSLQVSTPKIKISGKCEGKREKSILVISVTVNMKKTKKLENCNVGICFMWIAL
nr:hypothetical protein [Tanacetum cinerariifolium]